MELSNSISLGGIRPIDALGRGMQETDIAAGAAATATVSGVLSDARSVDLRRQDIHERSH